MRWTPRLVAAAAAIGVAVLGAAATDIGPWYFELHKPSWQPPDWLFAPVWTVIYALTAISGVIAWRHSASRSARRTLLVLFAVNALLNVVWSDLFFTMRRPDWALWEVVPFFLSIVALIAATRRASGTSAALLVPYLAWVAFAGWLNLAIVQLNGPFG